MKRLVVLQVALALGCAAPDHRRVQPRTLSSGRVVEVTAQAIAGPADARYLWFEYQTEAAVPEPLLSEIREIWLDLRSEGTSAGVPMVVVEAIARHRRIRWEGLILERVAREKGCVSYTKLSTGNGRSQRWRAASQSRARLARKRSWARMPRFSRVLGLTDVEREAPRAVVGEAIAPLLPLHPVARPGS